ncbi:MAG: ribose 5-phosphate isomerase B [Oscillospiraceae bacterium]|nr:ribose 5-phosphate isomerase B [Oscillospiraceae bacterium]MBQ5816095.1 ribose 5-phosphate isomerase B [Oscillospiraceae bacterium]
MIAIACDHGGLKLKGAVMDFLKENGYEFKDFGTHSEQSCDYADYAKEVAFAVTNGECERGILICGTGIGMSIAANKVKGIRAAHCTDYFSAKYTRLHNDANILCLGERITGAGLALELVKIFLETEFEGGRHAQRIAKIAELEK